MEPHQHDPLEQLLKAGPLQVPEGFSGRIMQRIQYLPLPERDSKPLEWLQWLALAGGALLGLEQLTAFMFGVWLASSAG